MFGRWICSFVLAVLYASTTTLAQNAHVNREGRVQMNDAAPIDDTKESMQPHEPLQSDIRLFPQSQSPDDAAAEAPSVQRQEDGEK